MAFGLGLAGLMGGVQGLGLGMQDIAQRNFEQNQFDQRMALATRHQQMLEDEMRANEAAKWVTGDDVRSLSGLLGIPVPEGTALPTRIQATAMPAIVGAWKEQQKEAAARQDAQNMANAMDPTGAPGFIGPPSPDVDPFSRQVAALYRSGHAPTPAEVQTIAAVANRNRNLAANAKIADMIEAQGPRVTQPLQDLPGDLDQAAAALPKVLTPQAALMAAMIRGSDQPQDIDQLLKVLQVKSGGAPISVAPGHTLVDPTTFQTRFTAPAAPEKEGQNQTFRVQANGREYLVTMDREGNRIATEDVGAASTSGGSASERVDNLMVEYQKLLHSGVSENDPRAKDLKQRIEAQKTQMLMPGGTPFTGGFGATGPQTAFPPAPGERERLGGYRAGVMLLDNLLAGAEDPKVSQFFDTGGALRVAVQDKLAQYGIRKELTTPEYQQWAAQTFAELTRMRTELIGRAQTGPELRGLLPATPSGPNDPKLLPILRAWRNYMEINRDALSQEITGVGGKTAPPPGSKADAPASRTTQPGAPTEGSRRIIDPEAIDPRTGKKGRMGWLPPGATMPPGARYAD